jgi:hypothetical protein
MRIKYVIEQEIYHLRINAKPTGRLSFGYFSLATQRKVTGVLNAYFK